ncbi:7SK snRNA methylphosphate capping enzyme [Trichinella spiralis]|uniref:7SK snRNA methylphosphate capping enzyme n=1 Tax=Trichinella spiralis TaxID=6334 RepID=UPI0001EFB252|nr:7SK snRNA methylphosphate capping enzyme [Trichinella spiralis]
MKRVRRRRHADVDLDHNLVIFLNHYLGCSVSPMAGGRFSPHIYYTSLFKSKIFLTVLYKYTTGKLLVLYCERPGKIRPRLPTGWANRHRRLAFPAKTTTIVTSTTTTTTTTTITTIATTITIDASSAQRKKLIVIY